MFLLCGGLPRLFDFWLLLETKGYVRESVRAIPSTHVIIQCVSNATSTGQHPHHPKTLAME